MEGAGDVVGAFVVRASVVSGNIRPSVVSSGSSGESVVTSITPDPELLSER